MQGLNPFQRGEGSNGRFAPVRPVGARPAPAAPSAPRRAPGPSRLAYRWNRLLLRPLYRRLIRLGLPAFVAAMVVGLYLGDADRRANIKGGFDSMVQSIQTRDEFMVHAMTISGASPAVDKGLREMLPVTLPASSFDINLVAFRQRIEGLDAVESVDLRIKPGGVLDAIVRERVPVLLWRHLGGIDLLDKTGHRVASVTSRDVRRDLPVISGAGADSVAPEALALIDAAGPILPRLRGLERVGERRWDVVLDHGQRVMLPAEGAVPAFETLIAANSTSDLLSRDVAVVDLRLGGHQVLRLGLTAQNTLRRARGEPQLDANGQPVIDDAAEAAGSANVAKAGAKPASGKAAAQKSAPSKSRTGKPAASKPAASKPVAARGAGPKAAKTAG